MKDFKLTLTPIQKETIEFCLKSPYAVIALRMGLGKTNLSIYLAHLLKSKCLVVAPAGLLLNWAHELKKCLVNPRVLVIRKGNDFEKLNLGRVYDFIIVSYDLAIRNEALFEWTNLVFFDEANHLAHMNTKRTSSIHKLVYENSIPRMYLLTGTPIKNRVEEYYSLITLCNYNPALKTTSFLDKFPESVSFADHFSYRHDYTKPVYKYGKEYSITISKWDGLRNEEELKSWLKGIYFMRKGQAQDFRRIDVILSDKDNPDLLAQFEIAMEGVGTSVMSNVKKDAAIQKAPLTISYLKDLLATKEIDSAVVFSDHRDPAHLIAKAFNTKALTGEISAKERQKIADDFQRGRCPVIVGTIKAMGTGLTLTRANNVVFNDFSWVPGDIEQAEFRINRIGQTRPCVSHRILGSPQDEYILRTIENKKTTIKKLEAL